MPPGNRPASSLSRVVLRAPVGIALLVASLFVPLATAGPSLESQLRAALQHKALNGAKLGIQVASLDTGEILFAQDPHVPLIPASNTKIVTATVALEVLGADYQFHTEVAGCGELVAGRLAGDLIVTGGGDPSFRDDLCEGDGWRPLRDLAAQVAASGVGEVTGDLVLDDRLFDREFTAPTWPVDQLNRDYCAPVAALSLRGNCLRVAVDPPRTAGALAAVRLEPDLAPFRLQAEIVGTAVKGQNEVVLLQPDASGRLVAKGRTWVGNPTESYAVPVTDPVGYFGAALQRCLDEGGVRVRGKVRCVQADDASRQRRALARLSTPLSRVLVQMNKESDNNIAEHLFKLSAARRLGQGSFANGADVTRAVLASLGIGEAEQRFVDGSGMSRENRISPAALTTLLMRNYQGRARDLFVSSLPIAGIDGSLRNRLTEEPFRGHVRAKTGFINRVSALCGYVRTLGGGSLVFALMMNDFAASNATMKEIQDNICRVLVRHSTNEAGNPGG